jgi:alpha-1,2-mannosyltransferase
MLQWLRAWPDTLAGIVERHRQLCIVLAALLLGAFATATYLRYDTKIRELSSDDTYTKSAILRWRPQLEALDHGTDIYDKFQYPNPPIMALILKPLTVLPVFSQAAVWFFLKIVMAVLCYRLVFRFAAPVGQTFQLGAMLLVILLSLHPIFGDLSHGNVNIFIALLVFVSLEFLRQRRDLLCGVTLGLAIACKVTPLLFVPYFGWKIVVALWSAVRNKQPLLKGVWQGGGAVLLGVVVGLILFLHTLPGLLLGTEYNQRLLNSWYVQMVKPFVVDGKVTSEHPNQSIPGVVFRLLTHEPSDMIYDEDGKPAPNEYANLVDIGPANAKWIIRGCQALFVLFVAVLFRVNIVQERQGVRLAVECAAVLLGMLLFSERTWKHHATTLILPMAALVGSWAFGNLSGRRRLLLGLSLIAGVLLMTVPSFLSRKPQDFFMVYGSHTVGFTLLLANLGVLLWDERKA